MDVIKVNKSLVVELVSASESADDKPVIRLKRLGPQDASGRGDDESRVFYLRGNEVNKLVAALSEAAVRLQTASVSSGR
jgi:hypothetical protein